MSRSSPKKWTAEEQASLRELVKTKTYEQMGETFGCHPDAVRLKVRSLGLKKYKLNKSSSAQDLKVNAYSEEHGVSPAAKYFGITFDQVRNARKRVREKRELIKARFSREKFEKFRSVCYRTASAMGFGHDAEDFAGWAIIKTLEGRNADIGNLAVDYLRELYGRDEESEVKKVRDSIRYAAPIKDYDDPPGTPGVTVAAQDSLKTGTLFAIASMLKLDTYERLVFLLSYREGMDREEVSYYLGVSASRISQIISSIQDKLIRNAEAKAMLAD